jgi:DNA polymerase-3 subunit epsilon
MNTLDSQQSMFANNATSNYDFIAIDFETANKNKDSACQVGITTVKDGRIEDVKSWLINPKTFFQYYNTFIHGITKEKVENAPTFEELWPEISPYFDSKCLLFAHNASFDVNVLLCMLKKYEIEAPSVVFGCSLAMSRRVWPHEFSHSLGFLCEKFGITPGSHEAGEDARACAELILLAAKEREIDLGQIIAEGSFQNIGDSFQISLGSFDKSGYIPSTAKRLKQAPKIKPSSVANTAKNNPDSPFYQKNIVFTGTFNSMSRDELRQLITDIGGINRGSISSKTDFLIAGQQELYKVGESGLSYKQRKVIELRKQGINIEVLSEADFLQMR